MGVLLGGHAFDVPRSRLLLSLWLCVGTGIVLAGLETGGRLLWFHQVRGLMTMGKLVLICCVPFLEAYSLPILLVGLGARTVGEGLRLPRRLSPCAHGHRQRNCQAESGEPQHCSDYTD